LHIIEPEEGALACGDVGKGRLARVETIYERIRSLLSKPQDFAGIKMLITAGPTHEPIDPVRYITNPSSGKMGYALAQAAKERGADVVLVAGPTALAPPPNVKVVRVRSAAEMARAVEESYKDCRVFIGAAAVSDYTPERVADKKMKKSSDGLTLQLKPTVDIIGELGKRKGSRVLIGFSVETNDLVENSRRKLQKKNLDLIVCNDVTQSGAGFATDTNIVTILDAAGGAEQLPILPKIDTAHRILDKVHTLL
jgi:phosphopantothenoylcysteine decarboxylase/phosphopantothenate--cysteine ligase